MELQRARSFSRLHRAHDFRKEYRGSVLEKKFQAARDLRPERTSFRWFADWLVTRFALRTNKPRSASSCEFVSDSDIASPFDALPNELLTEVLARSDKKTLVSCRRVSRRFNGVAESVFSDEPVVLSRFMLTGLPKKSFEMRWVAYEGQRTKTINLPASDVRAVRDFSFNFQYFVIQRIILKDLQLTDELVDFIRHQIQFSDLSQLVQLSLHNVDFSQSNSLTLHRLLAVLAKNLEVFEVTQCYGMRADSVTDAHLAQLDSTRLRRISIDGVRFVSRVKALRVGDSSLRLFAASRSFPTMVLDRCLVSTATVCDYTQEWFQKSSESERSLRSQVCTVKRCPRVKSSAFEAECARRGLLCQNRRGSGSLTLYNIGHELHKRRAFTVALDDAQAKLQPESDDVPSSFAP